MVHVRRLGAAERDSARRLFALLAEVCAELHEPRDDAALDALLARSDFWALRTTKASCSAASSRTSCR